MSDFNLAIGVVLKHEGGYVDDPNDAGGATNYGISLRYLRDVGDLDGDGFKEGDFNCDGVVDVKDIQMMTLNDAINIYKTQWWDKYLYGQIPSQELATKVFDTSVNVGSRQCHKFLQRALNAVNGNQRVVVDGIIGPQTLGEVNSVNQEAILAAFRSEQAGFYRLIVEKRPLNKKFLKGWLRRAYS